MPYTFQISWRTKNYILQGQSDYSVGTFCGRVAPPPIELNIQHAVTFIYFQSDGSISGQGFNATYHHMDRSSK